MATLAVPQGDNRAESEISDLPLIDEMDIETEGGMKGLFRRKKNCIMISVGIAIVVTVFLAIVVSLAGAADGDTPEGETCDMRQMNRRLAQYAPTTIETDTTTKLSSEERKALKELISAAREIHSLFSKQVWSGNARVRNALASVGSSECAEVTGAFFDVNIGPWDLLDDETVFVDTRLFDDDPSASTIKIPDAPPPTANFYPIDMTRAEFEQFVASLPSTAAQDAARSFFTLIIRGQDKQLQVSPYSDAYGSDLGLVSKRLIAASDALPPGGQTGALKKYLQSRAAALSSNLYSASDRDWLDLTSNSTRIHVTLGPYETYLDKLFGYKASFEAELSLIDAPLTRQWNSVAAAAGRLSLPGLINKPSVLASSPSPPTSSALVIVDIVYTAGGLRQGVNTAAFNLPNDAAFVSQYGSKRVMFKNIQQAKFDNVLHPLAKLTLVSDQLALVNFDAFFSLILLHEMVHGLAPHFVAATGRSVRDALQSSYSAIEEARADICGLWALEQLSSSSSLLPIPKENAHATFLAGSFRSMRFGVAEAHGQAQTLIFNMLLDLGGYVYDEASRRFGIAGTQPMTDAIKQVCSTLVTVEQAGDRDRADQLLSKYAKALDPRVATALKQTTNVPVDIKPMFKVTGLDE